MFWYCPSVDNSHCTVNQEKCDWRLVDAFQKHLNIHERQDILHGPSSGLAIQSGELLPSTPRRPSYRVQYFLAKLYSFIYVGAQSPYTDDRKGISALVF